VSYIADNIKSVIQEKGYKQKNVAFKAGFSEKAFSDLLNGRKTIKAEMIPGIASALGVSPNRICNRPKT
jgi:transcriptional regulator with XRE-family HTH domain